MDHLRGNAEDATDVIGVFPLLTNDTCRFIGFDFDNHEKGAEKKILRILTMRGEMKMTA